MRRLALTALVAVTAAAGIAPAAASTAQRPAVYTTAQAASGAKIYATKCVACHGAKLEGGAGPTLVGPVFTASSLTFGALHSVVSNDMPQNNPGSLSAKEAADVIAYLLAANCYPAGKTAYPDDGNLPQRRAKVVSGAGAGKPCALPAR